MRFLPIIAACVVLSACATRPTESPSWVHADTAAEIDRIHLEAERDKRQTRQGILAMELPEDEEREMLANALAEIDRLAESRADLAKDANHRQFSADYSQCLAMSQGGETQYRSVPSSDTNSGTAGLATGVARGANMRTAANARRVQADIFHHCMIGRGYTRR